jgi:hypothetical protein
MNKTLYYFFLYLIVLLKSSLEGFFDPCFGETKQLYIEYNFNGEPYQAIFNDNELVRLPKASHKVQWWSRPFSSVKS